MTSYDKPNLKETSTYKPNLKNILYEKLNLKKGIFNIILEINRKPKQNHIKIRGKEVAVTCLIKLWPQLCTWYGR